MEVSALLLEVETLCCLEGTLTIEVEDFLQNMVITDYIYKDSLETRLTLLRAHSQVLLSRPSKMNTK